jgi:hypothetical protein
VRLNELVRIRNPASVGLDPDDWLGKIISIVIRPGGRHLVKVMSYGDHSEPHVFMTTELRDIGLKDKDMQVLVLDCTERLKRGRAKDIADACAQMADEQYIDGREQRRALYKRLQQEGQK